MNGLLKTPQKLAPVSQPQTPITGTPAAAPRRPVTPSVAKRKAQKTLIEMNGKIIYLCVCVCAINSFY